MKRILLCLMVALFATGCLFAKNNDEKMNVMSIIGKTKCERYKKRNAIIRV